MAVSYTGHAASSWQTASAINTGALSPSGSEGVVGAGIVWDGSATITAVTHGSGGPAMSAVSGATADYTTGLSIHGRGYARAVGSSSAGIWVTWSGAVTGSVLGIVQDGADQTTPTASGFGSSGSQAPVAGSSPATLTLTNSSISCAVGDMVNNFAFFQSQLSSMSGISSTSGTEVDQVALTFRMSAAYYDTCDSTSETANATGTCPAFYYTGYGYYSPRLSGVQVGFVIQQSGGGGTTATKLLDGKIVIRNKATKLLDGKIVLSNNATKLLDGLITIAQTATNLYDGKLVISTSATKLYDGLIVIQNNATKLLDGMIDIQSSANDLYDGKVVISDAAINLLDGALVIRDSATKLLDGLLEISVAGSATKLLDGKIIVSDLATNSLDGLLVIQDQATKLLDGLLNVQVSATNLMDGSITIQDVATKTLDGKIEIMVPASTSLLDGLLSILDAGATGGWAFYNAFHAEEGRRQALRLRRRKMIDRAQQIESELDRQLAVEIQKNEAETERQQELKRLHDLALRHKDSVDEALYGERVIVALTRATLQGNFSALEALERELNRLKEEEDFIIEAAKLFFYH